LNKYKKDQFFTPIDTVKEIFDTGEQEILPTDIYYDFFAGSGNLIEEAIKRGYKHIVGYEPDKKVFEVLVKRVEELKKFYSFEYKLHPEIMQTDPMFKNKSDFPKVGI
jgi:16S rRNA G966 N2-methylase RsmD